MNDFRISILSLCQIMVEYELGNTNISPMVCWVEKVADNVVPPLFIPVCEAEGCLP